MIPLFFAQLLTLEWAGCEAVDPPQIESLLAIELAAEPAEESSPVVVRVTCDGPSGHVWVRNSNTARQVTRSVELRALDAAARDARGRELALAISELVRTARSPESSIEPPVSRPKSDISEPTPPPPAARQPLFHLGLLFGVEAYSEGYWHAGPSLAFQLTPFDPLSFEARGGARFAPTQSSPSGDISVHAFALSLGMALNVLPRSAPVRLLIQGRGEADWVFVRGDAASGVTASAEQALGWVSGLGPGVHLKLFERVHAFAEVMVLVPLHSLTLEAAGSHVVGLDGIGAGASLGAWVSL